LLKEKAKLSISEKVLDKIKYLCDKYRSVEWSGIIWMDIEGIDKGVIEDASQIKIRVTDFTLFDIGTGAYTEFSIEPEIIMPIYEKYPDYMTKKYGCMHSHNTMGVFFSGTDTSTLLEQAFIHNFFVSLIVNNRLDKIAKISFQGEREVTETLYNRIGKVMLPYNVKNKEEVVYVVDCDVEYEGTVTQDAELVSQIEMVEKLEVKRRAAKFTPTAGVRTHYGKVWSDDDFGGAYNRHYPAPTHKQQKFKEKDEAFQQADMFDRKLQESRENLKKRCETFLKRVIGIDYTGFETEDMTLKEAWRYRELYYPSEESAKMTEYFEEAAEFVEDNLHDCFRKEIDKNWDDATSFRKLRALLAYNFHDLLDVKKDLERKVLEIIDLQLKELEKERDAITKP
jgi:hypothetical protein